MKAVAAAASALVLAGCALPRGFPPVCGVVNFDEVSSGRLYRSAQPTAEALRELKGRHGIRSVVDLRSDPWLVEREAAARLGMSYTAAPLPAMSLPSKEQVEEVLALLDAVPWPALVHCQYGCDRTGLVVACWRVRHGATVEEAVDDARKHGLSPFYGPGFKSLVRRFK